MPTDLAVGQLLFYLTALDNMYGSCGRTNGFECVILHYFCNTCQGPKFYIFSYSVNPPLKVKVGKECAFLFVFYIPVYCDHMTCIRSFNNWCEM